MDWITWYLADKEDQITGGRWNLDNFWKKVSVKLLKLLAVVNWRSKPVNRNVLAGVWEIWEQQYL